MPPNKINSNFQLISFVFYDLPASAVIRVVLRNTSASYFTLELPGFFQLGNLFGQPPRFSEFVVQRKRIMMSVEGAPSYFSLSVQMVCSETFLEGSVFVPDKVQTRIGSSIEALQIIGSGYWVVPIAMQDANNGDELVQKTPTSGARSELDPASQLTADLAKRVNVQENKK
jgi:hypothetical protein